jgi:HEAT repeat protein
MSLSSLIVQRGLATIRDVEDALARQVLYGGDLATNLLEVAAVNEADLAVVVAETFGRDAGPVKQLATPRAEVLAFVPAATAIKEGVLPIELHGTSLVVLVSEPLDADAEWRLSAEFSMPIVQRIVLAFRLRQGLSRAYRYPLERRFERLLLRLGESASTSDQQAHVVSVRESLGPSAFKAPSLRPGSTPPRASAPAAAITSNTAPPPRTRKKRKGPLTLELLKDEFVEAEERDTVLDLVFEFCGQYFEFSAIFIVHGDIAEGREARGEGTNAIHRVGIPLDLPSAFASARASKTPALYTLEASGVDGNIRKDLGRAPMGAVAVVPISVRGRVVAMVYGDDSDAAVSENTLQALSACATLASAGFEQVILRKKSAKERSSEPVPKPSAASAPAPAAPASALRDDVVTDRHPVLAQSDDPPPAHAAAVRRPVGPPIPREEDDDAPVRKDSRSFQAERPFHTPKPQRRISAPQKAVSQRMQKPKEEDVWKPDEQVAAPVAEPVEVWTPGQDGQHAPLPPSSAPSLDQLEDASARAFVEEINRRDSTPMPDGPLEESGYVGPASLAFSARPPAISAVRTAEELPSIIVDIEFEHAALVAKVCDSKDAEAASELIRLGKDAMPAIMARFPGPIDVEVSPTAPLPKASEAGPLLGLIARQRRIALPYILPYCDDGDLVRRLYATLLLTELSYPEATDAIARRIVDDDVRVRRAATLAGKLVAQQGPRPLIERLIGVAKDPLTPPIRCVILLGAVADLKQPIAVPMLIPFLSDPNSAVIGAARDALSLLARQDFKADPRKWASWWTSNVGRHRIEWLIDALLHDDNGLRRSAAIELAELTGLQFGLADEGIRKDRERVHLRFREWWLAQGRAKFDPDP